MKENFKKQKGITLIALIITIIILLILAIVSINIAINNGLITKSGEAKNKNTIAEEKELIELGYSDYKIAKYSGGEKTEDLETIKKYFQYFIDNEIDPFDEEKSEFGYYGEEKIVFKNNEVINDANISIKVIKMDLIGSGEINKIYMMYKNNQYLLSTGDTISIEYVYDPQFIVQGANVTGNENIGWTIAFNDTGNVYNIEKENEDEIKQIIPEELNKKVKIGDYVNYQPAEATYTSHVGTGKISGNGSREQEFSTTTQDNKWRVLDIKNNQVRLVNEKSIVTVDNKWFYLKGAIGYLYGEEELNNICGIYKDEKYATEARSINVNDIQEILDEIPDISERLMVESSGGNMTRYPTKENDDGYVDYPPGESREIIYNYANSQIMYNQGYGRINNNVLNNEKIKLLFETTDYWFATRCSNLASFPRFGLHYSNEITESYNSSNPPITGVSLFGVYKSAEISEEQKKVKAIVTLKENVLVISGDGTSENPYQIMVK